MSLINEALKKAQRQQAEAAANPSASAQPGGARIARRGKAQSTNTMVLLGSGALVLVVLSVVFTVFLVNRPSSSSPVAVSTPPETKPIPAAPVITEPATPAIVVPKITPAASAAAPAPTESSPIAQTPAVVALTPSSASSTPPAETIATTPPPLAVQQPTPAATQTAPAATPPASVAAAEQAPPPTLAPDAPDERVTAFVEGIRVTGIRSSGAESRVLMNERVYRVNDIVERTLGVRLVKAATDNLTFADSRGVIYVKRF